MTNENKKSKGIITIEEKNSAYQIDMYVRKDISYKMSLKFVERIKSQLMQSEISYL